MHHQTMRVLALALALAMSASRLGAQAPKIDPKHDALIATYCAAWGEPDATKRHQLLERVWATDGVYTDPTVRAAGRAALDAHIGAALQNGLPPGAHFIVLSHVDAHHGHFRFTWRLVAGDGKLVTEGIDFGELDTDGRIQRIVGFFGALAVVGGE